MTLFFYFFRRLRALREQISRSDLLPIVWLTGLLIALGTTAYAWIESWSWLDALYATIITITTVGYGDLAPRSPAGRLFAIFFTMIAIGIGGYTISSLAAYSVEGRHQKIAAKYRKRRMKQIEALQQHYILCGADMLGLRIAEEFYLSKIPYVIIDPDAEKLKTALLFSHPEYVQQKVQSLVDIAHVDLSHYEGLSLAELGDLLQTPYLQEDPTDDYVLLRAGIERAAGLIAAMPDDRDNLSIVIGARALSKRAENHHLQIMARAESPLHVRKLRLAGADTVRIPAVMSGLEMALHMTAPEVGNWWYSQIATKQHDHLPLRQIAVAEKPHWVDKTVAQIHETERCLLLAIKRNEAFLSPPTYDTILLRDDIAIVMGDDRHSQ